MRILGFVQICTYVLRYLPFNLFLNPTGRFVMQAMKQMEPQMKQAMQSFPKTVRAGSEPCGLTER